MTSYADQTAPATRENAGYIIQRAGPLPVHPSDRSCEIVLGYRPTTPTCYPYVVWTCYGHNDYNWGHYFQTRQDAEKFFQAKVRDELRARRDTRWTCIKM